VRGPLGGLRASPAVRHGLEATGHDVYFAEDSDDYEACYNPSDDTTGKDRAMGSDLPVLPLNSLDSGPVAYYDAHTARWLGPCRDRMAAISSSADIVLNVSGVNPLRSWHEKRRSVS